MGNPKQGQCSAHSPAGLCEKEVQCEEFFSFCFIYSFYDSCQACLSMLLRGFIKVPVGVVAFLAASSFVNSQSRKYIFINFRRWVCS